MKMVILAQPRSRGSGYAISITIKYVRTGFFCELWRGGDHEHGPVCETRFRLSFFSRSNKTTPLRTADTEWNTLNPVAKRTSRIVCGRQGIDEVWCMLRQFL